MAKGNFGERLQREREMREVSLNELTVGTRISSRYLEALENEEWDKLPGGVFNRGFVRSIARYLGLNEESLLAEYDLARGEERAEAPRPYENKIPRPPIWIPIAMLFGALAILAGLVAGGVYGWRRYVAHRLARPASSATSTSAPEAASATAPAPTATVTEGPTSQADSAADPAEVSDNVPLALLVSTSAATRIRIVGDNVVLLDEELPAGDTRHFSARKQFEVTASDSSAVLLELNGKAMPPIGAPGASGTMVLSQKDLRQAPGGTAQP